MTKKGYESSIDIRFFCYVRFTKNCWFWEGGLNSLGYGRLEYRRKKISAHRISWQIHNGKIPKNKFVLHECDIKICVNPSHLFLGTQQDNIRDMVIKKRHSHGEKHHDAKLKVSDIPEIRELCHSGISQLEIGKAYGVSQLTISAINNGRVWKSVS